MRKKLLCFILALAVILTALPMAGMEAKAEGETIINELHLTLNYDGFTKYTTDYTHKEADAQLRYLLGVESGVTEYKVWAPNSGLGIGHTTSTVGIGSVSDEKLTPENDYYATYYIQPVNSSDKVASYTDLTVYVNGKIAETMRGGTNYFVCVKLPPVTVASEPCVLNTHMISGIESVYEYTGSTIIPDYVVKDGDYTLVEGVDYYTQVADATEPGTATIKFIGMGSYEGEVVRTYTIRKTQVVSDIYLTFDFDNFQAYTTASTHEEAYAQIRDLLGASPLHDEYTYNYKYSGIYYYDVTQFVGISMVKEEHLKGGRNYYACFAIDAKDGFKFAPFDERKVYVNGVETEVQKLPSDNSVNAYILVKLPKVFAPLKAKLSTTSYTYNGKAKKPSVTVKSEGKTLASKITASTSKVSLTYDSGRKDVGTYTVTVKDKKNKRPAVELTFEIKPKKAALRSLTKGTGAITVKWYKKSPQVTGYELQYSRSSSFPSDGTTTEIIPSYKTVSKELTGLESKKKYYVRMRTYKTVGDKTYYGSWSSKKYTTTK